MPPLLESGKAVSAPEPAQKFGLEQISNSSQSSVMDVTVLEPDEV